MSEDYAKGFKDGFAAGLEEGKKINDKSYTDGFIDGMKKTMPPPYVAPTTPTPIWYQWQWHYPNVGIAYDNNVRGAVGSEVSQTFASGANGPVGSLDQGLGDIKWHR